MIRSLLLFSGQDDGKIGKLKIMSLSYWIRSIESYKEHSVKDKKSLWKIECFLEDLFLGGQLSIILGYRRLSVKFS